MLVAMLLRNSISSTKKFFQKTLRSFKSFFSGGAETEAYQKLPKTSPYNPYSFSTAAGVDMNPQTSYQDLEKFYSHFTDKWDSGNGMAKKRNKTTTKKRKKKIIISTPTEEQKEGNEGSVTQFITTQRTDHQDINQCNCKKRSAKVENKREEDSKSSGKSKRKEEEEEEEEARSLSVAQKLKEIEMMDMSNVDHVLDIEEVLHYYSRLTCPTYLDIVDKFFMDMYAEILGPTASSKSVSSRPKFRSVRS